MSKTQEQLAAEAVEKFQAEFKSFQAANDKSVAAVKELATANEVQAATAMKKAEQAIEEVKAAAASLAEIEQQVAGFVAETGKAPEAKTLGDFVIKSDVYKALTKEMQSGDAPPMGFKLLVQANTLSGQSGSPVENDDILVPTQRRAGIVPLATRALRVADVLRTVPISGHSWEFVKEKTWTNNAAETAEGASKPESVMEFETDTAQVRTIAHWIKATNQILADAPALRAYIDFRLRYGVEYRLDNQLLNGNGTGQNIGGMTKLGNYTAGATPASGDTAIDTLSKAKYALIGADFAASAIIMNPADWGAIERLKTSQNEYLVGNPFGTITPMMWGLPIVLTNAMASGKYLMADFETAYEHLARQGTTVDVGYDGNDFTKNLVTIRAERRDGLAVLAASRTRYGDLTL